MRAEIEAAAGAGDTVGGIFEVVVTGLPIGLGSCMAPDRKLDGRLAQALVSIPAVKGCEIGPAFDNARRRGSEVHDELLPRTGQTPARASNRAGGLEGGMTTGEPLICRGAMKPISTLRKPLASVDLATNQAQPAGFERSDICAVPSAGVAAEAAVLLVLADAVLEMFGGDTLARVRAGVEAYGARMRERMQEAGG
jgi:chorismate synthase